MKNNLKQELIFSAMMTFGMVLVMLSFNIILAVGFTSAALMGILTNVLPVFIVAFVVELLLVAHNVKKLHKIIVALLGVGMYLIVRSSQGNSAAVPQTDDALAILKKRYAASEIDKKEFDEKKKAIAD